MKFNSTPRNRRDFFLFSVGAAASSMKLTDDKHMKNERLKMDMLPEKVTKETIITHQFPYIEVSGSSYEMGYQHGAQIPDLIEKYLVLIERITNKSRDVLCRNAKGYIPLFEKFSSSYCEEMKGLAKGAGISFEEAVVCQLRGSAAYNPAHEGCTSFAMTGAATKNGLTYAGQNQDMEPEMADVGVILHLIPDNGRPRIINFTFAGQIGYHGMNSLGVSEFANALDGGKPIKTDAQAGCALGHYPLKRRMLESKNVQECIKLYRTHPMNGPANAMLCDGLGNIADLEIRPGLQVAEYKDESPAFIGHANHYVTPEFADPNRDNPESSSYIRHKRIHILVKENWGNITVDTIKKILADHEGDPGGICRHGLEGSHSICGYIAEANKGIFHVRRGHGCIGTWTAYEV